MQEYALAIVMAIEFRLSQFRQAKQPPWSWRRCNKTNIALNLSFATTLSVLLPPPYLVAIFAIWAIFDLLLDVYQINFGRILSGQVIIESVAEFTHLFRSISKFIPAKSVFRLFSFFAVKVSILYWAPLDLPYFTIPLSSAVVGTSSLLVYFAIVVFKVKKMQLANVTTSGEIDDFLTTFGNIIPRLAEIKNHSHQGQVAAKILASKSLSGFSRLLSTRVLPDQVIAIQIESLDLRVLNFDIDGKPVTPFLNKLFKIGCGTQIESCIKTGSSDADFTFLSGLQHFGAVSPYKLSKLSLSELDSLPKGFQQAGYRTAAFHGVTGKFFNRKNGFEKLGFGETSFLEELRLNTNLKMDSWGIRDPDLLRHTANLINSASEPGFYFVITVTSHTPFNFLRAEEHLIYQKPKTTYENYINSIAMVDRWLEQFVARLDHGLFLLYGDHPANFLPKESKPQDLQSSLVPFFAFNKSAPELLHSALGPNRRNGEVFSLIDLHQTLYELTKNAKTIAVNVS